MHKTYATLFVILLLAGTGCQDQPEAAADAAAAHENLPALLRYEADVPDAWTARPPSNRMRLAEYVVPVGADTAEVIVYYFGPGQGGSVEDNIERWSSQFAAPDGGTVTPKVTTLDGASLPTTLAFFTGTYARGVGMGGMRDDEVLSGHALLAAVVEAPEGNLFVQLFGPEAGVAAQRDVYLDFLRSIRP